MSNWAEYERALVQRGGITLWISEDAVAFWKPAPTGLRGGQKKFSDHAIETALMACNILNWMMAVGRPESFAIGE